MEDLNNKIPDQCLTSNGNNNLMNISRDIDSNVTDKDVKLHDSNKRFRTDSDNEDSSDKINDSRRKRRSKNDQNGRKFQCECGKSYLSQPALTNHKKTKHENGNSTTKRGRGRPRKNVRRILKIAKHVIKQS